MSKYEIETLKKARTWYQAGGQWVPGAAATTFQHSPYARATS